MNSHLKSGSRLRSAGRVWIHLLWITLAVASFAHAELFDRESPLPEIALPESAIGRDLVYADEAQLVARLLVSSAPEPRAGMLFELAEGWHIYWRNPGDTGLAPKIEIEAAGYQTGPIAWPAPSVYDEADGLFTTFGYSNRVLFSMPLQKIEASAAGDRKTVVRANAHVLVCRTECVPATFSLTSPLDGAMRAEHQPQIDRLFAEANDRAPISSADLDLAVQARWESEKPADDQVGQIRLDIDACASNRTSCTTTITSQHPLPFLPFEDVPFEFSNHRVVPDAESSKGASIRMRATRLEDGENRLRGLVLLEDTKGRVFHVEIDTPIEAPREQVLSAIASAPESGSRASSGAAATTLSIDHAGPGSNSTSIMSWVRVFLLALLGGLILNGMPCVLPVLAIKVVAIAGLAEKSSRHVRIQGLAYTGGVLASMAVLAAIVVSLRSAGHSVGWGFQFQEPLFVAAISALLVAFALNLFGVFEIDFGQGRLASVGQAGSETRRSVFEGLLAVLLATPCTAPFLGTAVGFAFAASGLTILTIFLAIGLGLALPFLAVSFAPGLARFIPRSGPWMLKLRAGLGFSLLATVGWLLWVVGQSGGANAVVGLTAMLLVLAFMLWGFGQAQPLTSPWLSRGAAVAILTIAFAGFNLIEFDASKAQDRVGPLDSSTSIAASNSDWQPYSEEGVAHALAAGRPAFVVFTADWCITCKVNEKTVLERSGIREAFSRGDHALFKADWTRRDEPIRAKLSEFGRAGVPLYLVYSPDAPNDPEILSELLSQTEVRAALERSRTRHSG